MYAYQVRTMDQRYWVVIHELTHEITHFMGKNTEHCENHCALKIAWCCHEKGMKMMFNGTFSFLFRVLQCYERFCRVGHMKSLVESLDLCIEGLTSVACTSMHARQRVS